MNLASYILVGVIALLLGLALGFGVSASKVSSEIDPIFNKWLSTFHVVNGSNGVNGINGTNGLNGVDGLNGSVDYQNVFLINQSNDVRNNSILSIQNMTLSSIGNKPCPTSGGVICRNNSGLIFAP